MQGQTRKGSLVEAVTNILVGVVLAFTSQAIIFHHFGYPISWETNAWMTLWFTLISLARSFILRRIFNRITYKHEQKKIQSYRTATPTQLTRPTDYWGPIRRFYENPDRESSTTV